MICRGDARGPGWAEVSPGHALLLLQRPIPPEQAPGEELPWVWAPFPSCWGDYTVNIHLGGSEGTACGWRGGCGVASQGTTR